MSAPNSTSAREVARTHTTRRHARPPTGRRWLARVIAIGVVLLGAIGSWLAARSVATSETDTARAATERRATEIVGALQRSIERQADLVASAGLFLLDHPDVTSTRLTEWATAAEATTRSPSLRSLSVIRVLTADQLDAYADVLRAEKVGVPSLGPDEPLVLMPPGERPVYCLLQAGVTYDPSLPDVPTGFDLCQFGIEQPILTARDSGAGSYVVQPFAGGSYFVVQTPVYRGGLVPATVEERRELFAGGIATTADPATIFQEALAAHPGMTVDLSYTGGGTEIVLSSGAPPDDAYTVVSGFGSGWTATMFAPEIEVGILDSDGALGLLASGTLAGLLLGLLVEVLGTSRARALRLVDQRTDELRHQALHDALTSLPNRALIIDRIEQLLARSRRAGTEGAALYVDLDGFKDINDTLGHDAGDRLLRAVATRLASTVRSADTIGRMGGDEFVVLIDGGTLQVSPELVAERMLQVMREPFDIELDNGPVSLRVTASIGIATGDRETAGDLLRDADLALYEAKAAGRDCARVFEPEMHTAVAHRVGLELDLRRALDSGEFSLRYQPIYDLSDLSLIGVEALLRWHHPVQGVIQPNIFIPVLEQTGQIVEVGEWVLAAACAQTATWRRGGRDLGIAVNISGRQLDHESIVDHVRRALETSGLEPSALTIEVTESVLMRDPESTATRLRQIKDLGVKVAIDDFGTGYSSLAYLQQFPVDSLKIDRTFTQAIHTSPESDALIRTLVRLGRDLGLRTLAEGVETIEQLDQLRGEQVDQAQGFLFARPLTVAAMESTIMAANPTQDARDDTSR